jgi:tetratricopeptide (TPR) repeat protein
VNAAPDFVEARLNLGNAYRGKQELTKALSQYKQVVKLKPDLADTYYNLAVLHLDSELPNMPAADRLQAAIAYFDQYRQKGGKDDRIDQYVKDARKGIDKEQRRVERERKDQLKKAGQTAADTGQPVAESSAGDATSPAPSKKAGSKSNTRKKRTVVAPSTPTSNNATDDPPPPARKRTRSGRLAEQGK